MQPQKTLNYHTSNSQSFRMNALRFDLCHDFYETLSHLQQYVVCQRSLKKNLLAFVF